MLTSRFSVYTGGGCTVSLFVVIEEGVIGRHYATCPALPILSNKDKRFDMDMAECDSCTHF